MPFNKNPTTFMQWRPYQKEFFSSFIDFYKKNKKKGKILSCMAVQATGTGKRAEAVAIAVKFPNTLFLADEEELIGQAYDDFVAVYGEHNVGMIRGNRFETDRMITISSPQTLRNRMRKLPQDHFSFIIVDECHRYGAKTYTDVVEYFSPWARIGFTATPFRLDGISVHNLFENTVFEYDILDGIKHGYLCELKGIRVKTNLELSKVGKSMGDFNLSELRSVVDTRERNALVVNKYKEYATGRQAICFSCDIEHAKNLKEIFDEYEISCEIMVSDREITEDRKETLARFRRREFYVLICVNMGTTGLDYSNIGCVLWARPTMSKTLYIQGCGRIIRLKDEEYVSQFGQQALVIDFVDNTTKHTLVNAYELDKGKNPEDRVFTSKEDKEKLIAARNKRTFEAGTNRDENADLMALPVISYDSAKAWMHAAPTEAQIEFAKRLGVYDDDMVYTKGLLAELISNAPAQSWQVKKVHEWGYDISRGVTMGQYNKIRAEQDEKTPAKKMSRRA